MCDAADEAEKRGKGYLPSPFCFLYVVGYWLRGILKGATMTNYFKIDCGGRIRQMRVSR